MTSVGIGYRPLRMQEPEFFKLPFNELLAGLSAKQKQYDTVEDDKEKLFEGLLKVNPYYSSDKELFNQYQSNLYTDIDKIVDNYGGDLSQAGPEIKKIARKVNKDLTSGNLATINYNTEQAKKILEDQAAAQKEGKFGEYSQALGLYPQFQARQQMSLQEAIDPNTGQLNKLDFSGVHRQAQRIDEVKDIYDPLKANSVLTDYFDPNTGYQIKKADEGVYKPVIYQAALQNLDALSPSFKAELDYQVKSGMLPIKENAELFLQNITGKKDVSALMENLSIADLEYYAKANEVGKLGENRIFTKTQDAATPNVAYWNLQRELQKEELAREVTTVYDPAIKEEVLYAGTPKEFANGVVITPKEIEEDIKFKNGKVHTPYKSGEKQMTALDVKETILEDEQTNFVKELYVKYPELKGTTEEQAYNLYKNAKKDASATLSKRFEVSNIAKTEFKKKLLEGTGSLIGRDMQLKDSKGIDNDVNADNLADKLGYDADSKEFIEALKNAQVTGFSLTNDKIPGAYTVDIQSTDGVRRLFIAPDVEIQTQAKAPAELSKLYKTSAATGQGQKFTDPLARVEFEIIPNLKVSSDKKSANFNPKIFVKDLDTNTIEETTLEDILNSYEKKISSLPFLGRNYKQTLSKQEKQ